MADPTRLQGRRRDRAAEENITDNGEGTQLPTFRSFGSSLSANVRRLASPPLERDAIHKALAPDRESVSFYEASDGCRGSFASFTSYQSLRVTVGSDGKLNTQRASIVSSVSKRSSVSNQAAAGSTGSTSQRNSMLGQAYFAAEDAQDEEEISRVRQFERAVSMELHRYGGSLTGSVPTEMLSNGGLQSSSSNRLPSSALLPRGYSDAQSNGGMQSSSSTRPSSVIFVGGRVLDVNGNFQNPASPRYSSDLLGYASPVDPGNGGFQSSSSRSAALELNDYASLSQQPSGDLPPIIPFERPVARRSWVTSIPRSDQVSPDMEEVDEDEDSWMTEEPESEPELKPKPESKPKQARVKRRSRISIANYSDDSNTSSLRTRYASSDLILLPPDYTRVAPIPSNKPQPLSTNAVITEELARHRRRERKRAEGRRIEAERRRRRRERYQLQSTPPTITVEPPTSSSGAAGPYERLSHRSSSSNGSRPRRIIRETSTWRHVSFIDPYSVALPSVQPFNFIPRERKTIPKTPKPVDTPDKRTQVLPRGPTMTSLMSPSPRVEGTYFEESYIIETPMPAPKSEVAKGLYDKPELAHIRRKVREEGFVERIPTQPYLDGRKLTKQDFLADNPTCIRYSWIALFLCSLTFVLLPFFATKRLDFMIKKWTSDRIVCFTKDSQSVAWLVFIGEVVTIIISAIVAVVVTLSRRAHST